MVSTLSLKFLPLSDFESGGDNFTVQLLDLLPKLSFLDGIYFQVF